MNLSKITAMASLLALTSMASCEKAAEEVIIEQPEVKIENGQFTPEALILTRKCHLMEQKFFMV